MGQFKGTPGPWHVVIMVIITTLKRVVRQSETCAPQCVGLTMMFIVAR